MKERNYTLDLIRVIACLLVIIRHAPNPEIGLSGLICAGDSLVTDPCIGLFFMVSGALLLPVQLSYKDFLKKRLNKVLLPTLIFTCFYLCVKFFYGEVTLYELPVIIASIPFSAQGHGILWFMYVMIGLYLIAPIITPWLEKASKKELQFALLLWGITLCWPYLNLIVNVTTGNTSMLHLFSGYAGYFVLGFYFKKYPIRLPLWTILTFAALPFPVYLAFKKFSIASFSNEYEYLSITVALMTIAYWQFLQQYDLTKIMGEKCKLLLVDFSNCSFGIYLIHIFIMRRLIWNIEFLHTTPPLCAIINNNLINNCTVMGFCSPRITNSDRRLYYWL